MNLADQLCTRWLELRLELDSAKSSAPQAHPALRFRARCARCRALATESRIQVENESKQRAWTCSRCGAGWPFDLLHLSHTGIQQGRIVNGRAAKLEQLSALTELLRDLSEREQRIYVQLYLLEAVGSWERIAEIANDRWPSMRPIYRGTGVAPKEWTRATVRSVVHDARSKILQQRERRNGTRAR